MRDTTKLYASTTNAGKLREFASAAQPAGIEVLELPGLKAMPEPVEDAATFLGNAELKAVAYSKLALESRRSGLLVFADDSGLEVDALGGEPGVRSARYADDAGYQASSGTSKDARNNALLLERLNAVSMVRRSARFVCALVLARDGKVLLRAMGRCEGEILDAPRGAAGFGYDPLFLLPDLGLTTAELAPEQKWLVSHRGNAFRSLIEQLKTIDL
jgi:XTP/dITP diphosphohydrolase